MTRIRVGVLRGGPSSEYEVSLKSGGTVLKHLSEKYEPHDILISRDGTWHHRGMAIEPASLPRRVDVVFNALHGEFGEDGTVQRHLDAYGVPYTGSASMPSAMGINKSLTKDVVRRLGIKVPYGAVYTTAHGSPEEVALKAFNHVPSWWIVKPVSLGSSVGTSLAKNYMQLVEAVYKCFEVSSSILIEEAIKGREATCGVIDDFRGQDLYALPPVQIIPPAEKTHFDYEAKYGGGSREICPGHFTRDESENIMETARRAHRALGLRHYSRSDFIVSPRGLYMLEVNTLPGLTEESLLPKSLAAVGATPGHFIDHVLELALSGK
jgi:D-alanine-D-alanine ligase